MNDDSSTYFKLNNLSIYSRMKSDFISLLEKYLQEMKKGYVCITGIHGITESLLNQEVFEAHKAATFIVPDGMPLVWLGRIAGHNLMERLYGPDLFWDINKLCEKHNYSVYLYGSTLSVLNKLKKNLQKKLPALQILGCYSPPFRPLDRKKQKQIARIINQANPDLLWIGLNTPKQELWMHDMRPLLQAKLLLGVGAGFDYATGTKKQAPIWMRKIGLEWLFRLIHEPRRLWRRYVQCVFLFPLLCLMVIRMVIDKKLRTLISQ